MSGHVRYSLFISGRVQGVGYRYFVQETATRLNIYGWVRNLHDGRVEAEVEGREEDIKSLLDQLNQGPSFSHISSVNSTELSSLANHTDFRITRDG